MGSAETLMGTRPMTGMTPEDDNGKLEGAGLLPVVRDRAWEPGCLGQRPVGPHGKAMVGVSAQSARGSAKSLSLAVTADQSSARNEDFRT